MSAPPVAATDLSETSARTQGDATDVAYLAYLARDVQRYAAEQGFERVGNRRAYRIAREFVAAGCEISRMSFRSWLQVRGDLLVVPATYRQIAARTVNDGMRR